MTSTQPLRGRFAQCTIDAGARSLCRHGQPQGLEPKAFDALAYLIEHRDRVVPKSELLKAVWGERVVVTEGVVARTVMKVRKAVGDDAATPCIVATVHRIGYRFTARFEPLDPPSSVPPDLAAADPPAAERPAGLAVLPWTLQLPDDAHGWTSLGLMAMTEAALRQHGVPGVKPSGEVAIALPQGVPGGIDDIALCETLEVARLVHATLVGEADGGLRLRYRGAGMWPGLLTGELRGTDPCALARELALRVLDASGPSQRTPAVEAVGGDRPARDAALAAVQQERYALAHGLLQLAGDRADELLRSQVEVGLSASRSDVRARQLLERARERRDERLECAALMMVAQCERDLGRERQGEAMLSEAVRLASRRAGRPFEAPALVSLARLHLDLGRQEPAEWALDRAMSLAQARGDRATQARAMLVRGQIALHRGLTRLAIEELLQALRECRAQGLAAACSEGACALGVAHAALGQLALAATWFARALDDAIEAGMPPLIAAASMALHGVDVQPGRAWRTARLMHRLRRSSAATHRIVVAATAWVRTHGLMRAGRLDDALAAVEPLDPCDLPGWLAAAVAGAQVRARLLTGRSREAAQALDRLQAALPRQAAPSRLAPLAHARALIAERDGDLAGAAAWLKEAIAAAPPGLDAVLMRLDAAWIDLYLGRRDAARALLAPVAAFLAQCEREAAPAAQRAWAQLQRAEQRLDLRQHSLLPPAAPGEHGLPPSLGWVTPDEAPAHDVPKAREPAGPWRCPARAVTA